MDNFVYIFQNPYKKKMCALKYLILQSEQFFRTDCSKFLQHVLLYYPLLFRTHYLSFFCNGIFLCMHKNGTL
jgi:hypothetical protein